MLRSSQLFGFGIEFHPLILSMYIFENLYLRISKVDVGDPEISIHPKIEPSPAEMVVQCFVLWIMRHDVEYFFRPVREYAEAHDVMTFLDHVSSTVTRWDRNLRLGAYFFLHPNLLWESLVRKLTASDRESLIKLASSLPKGDETRKAILAGLKTAGIPDQEARPASADALLKITSSFPGRKVTDHGDLGANIGYVVKGESNAKVGSALIKLLTSHGFTNVVKGKFMGEIGFSAIYREGGRIFATLRSQTRGGRVTTYVSVEARNPVGRSAASNEPMARALERMNDALDRGGIDAMIKATAARLKATRDPSKTLGIAMAIKQFLAQYSSTLSSSQEKELLWLQNSAEGTGTLGGGVVATRTEVPGPGATVVKDAYNYQWAILPAGYVDVATGANQYWDLDDTTAEVWKDGDNKLFVVVTHGHKPLQGIGSFCSFKHDQTGRPLRLGARMIGWFTLDPAGKFGGDIPKSGKLPVSTYK